jgi:hypothetical protein
MYMTATTPHASRGLSAIFGDVTKFLTVKTLRQSISGLIGFYLNDYNTDICWSKNLCCFGYLLKSNEEERNFLGVPLKSSAVRRQLPDAHNAESEFC